MTLFNTVKNKNAIFDTSADQIYWYDSSLKKDFDIFGNDVLDNPLRDLGGLEKTTTNAKKILHMITHQKQLKGSNGQIVSDTQLQQDLSICQESLSRIAGKVNARMQAIKQALEKQPEQSSRFTNITKRLALRYNQIDNLTQRMQEVIDMVQLRSKDSDIQEKSIRLAKFDSYLPKTIEEESLLSK